MISEHLRQSKRESNRKYRLRNRSVILRKKSERYQQKQASLGKIYIPLSVRSENKKTRQESNAYKNIWAQAKRRKSGTKPRRIGRDPEAKKEWESDRYNTDPVFRVTKNIRLRIRLALRKYKKSAATEKLTGCPFSYLHLWLQAQFLPGMTWENHGEWHIDHIRPCNSFNLFDPLEQKRCFHYTNLQPLWATDNLSKGAKWSGTPE